MKVLLKTRSKIRFPRGHVGSAGSPLWIFKKSKKNFKFFEKNFIIKKCAYGPKMKPRQVLGKYLEVYGQGNPITPEAGKKRAPFFFVMIFFSKVPTKSSKIFRLKKC